MISHISTYLGVPKDMEDPVHRSVAALEGIRGIADPPKILELIEKKLEIEPPDPPRSKARQSDPPG